MKKFAIIGSRKPPRIGCFAIIGGALLCSIAAAASAQSADLYPRPYPYQYQYSGYPGYNGYYRNCYSCCNPCCYCGYRPYVRPGPVVERHWDYWERRYPPPYPYRYPYYSNGYGGYPYNPYPDGYSAYGGGPRPHLGFGGVQYAPGAAPISYEYEGPRGPYEYEASARPAYDYDASPRPPAGIPGGYYNAGYVE